MSELVGATVPMDPLDFLKQEELLLFFHRKKTEISSCMDQPHTFLSQLRDYDLVSEKLYQVCNITLNSIQWACCIAPLARSASWLCWVQGLLALVCQKVIYRLSYMSGLPYPISWHILLSKPMVNYAELSTGLFAQKP